MGIFIITIQFTIHLKKVLALMMCLLPLPVEVDDLKKVSNSLSVLLSEKQKQEKVSALFFRK